MNNIYLTPAEATQILDYIRHLHIAHGFDLDDAVLIQKLMKIKEKKENT